MDKEKIRQEAIENSDTSSECEVNNEQHEECTSEHENNLSENNSNQDSQMLDELKQKLAEAEQKCDEYLSIAQRIQADFENYKRRNKLLSLMRIAMEH
jgi:hypothetical protein